MSQRRLPEPHLRDEFRRELRARLMREAAVTLTGKRRDNAWTAWLRPALAVGFAALVLIAGATSAAAGSVPGDPAFGLKRAIEEVRVALTFDDVERVRVLADIADQRLSELAQVATRDDKAPTASAESRTTSPPPSWACERCTACSSSRRRTAGGSTCTATKPTTPAAASSR